jgi:hypothetical protein
LATSYLQWPLVLLGTQGVVNHQWDDDEYKWFFVQKLKNLKVALHPWIQHQHHCLYNQTPPIDSTSTPLPSEPNSTHGFNINTIAFTTKFHQWIQHQHHCIYNQTKGAAFCRGVGFNQGNGD